MYIKNRSGPITDPWGTPEITGTEEDATPLTTTLFAVYQVTVNPLQDERVEFKLTQLVHEVLMWDSVKGLLEIEENTAHIFFVI